MMITDIFELRRIYSDLLNNVPNKIKYPLYPFFVQVGTNYITSNPKMMFVGKSVNGWVTDSTNVDDLFDENNSERIVNRHDQLSWVNDLEGPNDIYNTKKSAFWRVIKQISISIHDTNEWYNNIAWSNLYKLSPEKGNPNSQLQNMQRNYCTDILNEEIRVLNPDIVIFLTSFWEDFYINSIGLDQSKSKSISWNGYDLKHQIYKKRLFIQSMHPQGKSESGHINAILKCIKSNITIASTLYDETSVNM